MRVHYDLFIEKIHINLPLDGQRARRGKQIHFLTLVIRISIFI